MIWLVPSPLIDLRVNIAEQSYVDILLWLTNFQAERPLGQNVSLHGGWDTQDFQKHVLLSDMISHTAL